MLKVDNLYKYYNSNKSNEVKAVDGISLELPEKGLIVLLGRSGCGKSTLLNVLGGLDDFNDGVIQIDGEKFNKYTPKAFDELRNKKIGYVFQNYNLVPDMTVKENLKISLDLSGIVDDQQSRIDYALSLVGMQKYQNRLPNTLSGGQQQRVGIARAIVKYPEILLADEPTGNLDDTNTVAVMQILKALSKSCLVIMVTHEENLADFYADRIIRLSDGKIVSDELNQGTKTLDHKAKDVIYLGDLERKDISENGLDVELYGDGKDVGAKIQIVSQDNKIYLKILSNKVINVVDDDSSIKFTDEHYTVQENNQDVLELNVDKLKASERKKKSSLDHKTTCKKIFDEYVQTRGQRKKNRFRTLFISAIFFVLLIGVNAGSLVYDPFTSSPADSHVICINANKETVEGLNLDGRILDKNIQYGVQLSIDRSPFDASVEICYAANSIVLPASIVGKELNQGEIAIDKRLFDRGVKNSTLPDVGIIYPEQLIGMRVDIDDLAYPPVFWDFPQEEQNDNENDPNKPTAYALDAQTATIPFLKVVEIIDRNEPVIYISDQDYSKLGDFNEKVYSGDNTFFYAKEVNKTIKTLKNKGIKAVSYNKYFERSFYKVAIAGNILSLLVVIVVLVVQLIGAYKLTRSRFIANSKKYAILRTIGVTKREVSLNVFLESLTIFGLSSFKGWLFTSIIMFAADNMSIISNLEDMLGLQLIYYPVWLAFLSLGILALFSLTISLLTPISYLTKTPAKLNSAYDL